MQYMELKSQSLSSKNKITTTPGSAALVVEGEARRCRRRTYGRSLRLHVNVLYLGKIKPQPTWNAYTYTYSTCIILIVLYFSFATCRVTRKIYINTR